MGHYANLLILSPAQHDYGKEHWLFETATTPPPDKRCTVWTIQQILNLGYVTAPVNSEGFSERPTRMRAALHFETCFYRVLQEQIHIQREKCFAPPFTIVKAGESAQEVTYPKWIDEYTRDNIKGKSFIVPHGRYSIHDQIPRQHVAEYHNGLATHAPRSVLGDFLGYPLVWFPCGQVAEWVKARMGDSHWSARIQGDSEALAFVTLWSSALEAMSNTSAMCLFLFDEIGIEMDVL